MLSKIVYKITWPVMNVLYYLCAIVFYPFRLIWQALKNTSGFRSTRKDSDNQRKVKKKSKYLDPQRQKDIQDNYHKSFESQAIDQKSDYKGSGKQGVLPDNSTALVCRKVVSQRPRYHYARVLSAYCSYIFWADNRQLFRRFRMGNTTVITDVTYRRSYLQQETSNMFNFDAIPVICRKDRQRYLTDGGGEKGIYSPRYPQIEMPKTDTPSMYNIKQEEVFSIFSQSSTEILVDLHESFTPKSISITMHNLRSILNEEDAPQTKVELEAIVTSYKILKDVQILENNREKLHAVMLGNRQKPYVEEDINHWIYPEIDQSLGYEVESCISEVKASHTVNMNSQDAPVEIQAPRPIKSKTEPKLEKSSSDGYEHNNRTELIDKGNRQVAILNSMDKSWGREEGDTFFEGLQKKAKYLKQSLNQEGVEWGLFKSSNTRLPLAEQNLMRDIMKIVGKDTMLFWAKNSPTHSDNKQAGYKDWLTSLESWFADREVSKMLMESRNIIGKELLKNMPSLIDDAFCSREFSPPIYLSEAISCDSEDDTDTEVDNLDLEKEYNELSDNFKSITDIQEQKKNAETVSRESLSSTSNKKIDDRDNKSTREKVVDQSPIVKMPMTPSSRREHRAKKSLFNTPVTSGSRVEHGATQSEPRKKKVDGKSRAHHERKWR